MEQSEVVPQELVREFVIAGHGNLDRVKQMLAEHPTLLNTPYEWNVNDRETAIQAAAQVGSVPVAEYLMANGAPVEICTAAMLGRKTQVEKFLADKPNMIDAKGAHGIPLLTHAALSGNLELVCMLVSQGATAGLSSAFHNAVNKGHRELARWFLENTKPDLTWKNYQGKTAMNVAEEHRDDEMVALLRKHHSPAWATSKRTGKPRDSPLSDR